MKLDWIGKTIAAPTYLLLAFFFLFQISNDAFHKLYLIKSKSLKLIKKWNMSVNHHWFGGLRSHFSSNCLCTWEWELIYNFLYQFAVALGDVPRRKIKEDDRTLIMPSKPHETEHDFKLCSSLLRKSIFAVRFPKIWRMESIITAQHFLLSDVDTCPVEQK